MNLPPTARSNKPSPPKSWEPTGVSVAAALVEEAFSTIEDLDFDPMVDEEGTYLSEDFSFCRRWTAIGGEIWADLGSTLDHVGPSVFRGDFSTQFAPPRVEQAVA